MILIYQAKINIKLRYCNHQMIFFFFFYVIVRFSHFSLIYRVLYLNDAMGRGEINFLLNVLNIGTSTLKFYMKLFSSFLLPLSAEKKEKKNCSHII